MLSQLPRQLTEFPDWIPLDVQQFNEAVEVRRCGFDSPGTKNCAYSFARMEQLQRQALDRRFESLHQAILEAISEALKNAKPKQ